MFVGSRYTSPGSQLVITALLTSVEAVINLAWLAYEPAEVRDHFPSRDVRQRICAGLDDTSYLVGLAYPLVLIGTDRARPWRPSHVLLGHPVSTATLCFQDSASCTP